MLYQFQTHCDVNYVNWPFGEQNCTFTAGSWTYDMTQLDIQPYLSFDQLGGTDSNDTPLDFEHFLHKSKVSEVLRYFELSFLIPNLLTNPNEFYKKNTRKQIFSQYIQCCELQKNVTILLITEILVFYSFGSKLLLLT